MGKNCWFIFIDPLGEFVWKGVGLGWATFLPFSFVQRIALPLGRYEVNCAYSLIPSATALQTINFVPMFGQSTPTVVLH